MLKVSKLIQTLKKLPDGYFCYAYDGEMTGLIIVDKNYGEFGEIHTTDRYSEDSGELDVRQISE
jgi:hypothetical protein